MKTLAKISGLVPLDSESSKGVSPDLEIAGISFDSRKTQPKDLFFAIPGVRDDGSKFALDAVQRGAAAVVARRNTFSAPLGVPLIEVADVRHALAMAAAAFFPRQPETNVAVTGTSGKTSVVSFTRQIWENTGLSAASIGTTGVVAPGRSDYGELTTPDPVSLHELLNALSASGVTHTAMEASSHGLTQSRLDGVRLSAGAFTNLGRDHMDYHATIADYHAAKMRLFDTLLPKGAPAVIFADDAWSEATIEHARNAGLDVLTVGRGGSFLTIKRAEYERFSQHAEIRFGNTSFEVELPLAGDFQLSNALVAAGLAIATGTPAEKAMHALKSLRGASGRLELVASTQEGAQVYVDYAHKPEALENVLKAVRPFTTGRVIVVFGCGGDRDRGKRPIMGEIASRLADVVIITDDNPRSEDPGSIRKEILTAAWAATEIGDRREAIFTAVGMLKAGDTLIVAGKGHEHGQEIAGQKYPFSDHEVIQKAMEERGA